MEHTTNELTLTQRVALAILAAQAVIGDSCPEWSEWAEKWLSDTDRSKASALAAYFAADAAHFAAHAAYLAADAASYADQAVLCAVKANRKIDLLSLEQKALAY